MTGNRFRNAALLLTLVAVFSMTGFACDDDDSQSAGQGGSDSGEEFCEDLEEVEAGFNELQSLAPASSVEDALEVHGRIEDSLAEAEDSADGLYRNLVTAMGSAVEAIGDLLESRPETQSLTLIGSGLAELEAQLGLALTGLHRGAGCAQ